MFLGRKAGRTNRVDSTSSNPSYPGVFRFGVIGGEAGG